MAVLEVDADDEVLSTCLAHNLRVLEGQCDDPRELLVGILVNPAIRAIRSSSEGHT